MRFVLLSLIRCFLKVGLDFTPHWCSSEDNKTSQRQVLRAQVRVIMFMSLVVAKNF